ncbi:MAG: DUF1080 domain-containing protein [Deltaproteobacteria bacterium]|nr:DUF1080 domain-containing protein [Deltaproteobacteria bacterium]
MDKQQLGQTARKASQAAVAMIHVTRLAEDITRILEDVRRFGEAAGSKETGAIRGALEKVRHLVKKSEGPDGHEQAKPSTSKVAEFNKALEGMGQVAGELEKILSSLHGIVDKTISIAPQTKEAIGGAIDTAGQMVKSAQGVAAEAQKEAQRQGEGQPAPEQQAQQPQAQQQKPEQPQAQQHKPEQQGPRPSEDQLNLFDGSDRSFGDWQLVGSGSLFREGSTFRVQSGSERGLVYYVARRFDDFTLRMRFKPESQDFDMAAAVRFLDPTEPVPDRDNPAMTYPYDNQAYVAANTGFEIQLRPEAKIADWNELEIQVTGSQYTMRLNGRETARFSNADRYRGKPAAAGPHSGFIGVLMRRGSASFSNVQVEVHGPAEERQQQAGGNQPTQGQAGSSASP